MLSYTGTAIANSANVSANGTNFVSGITALANGTGSLASNYVLPSLTAYSTNNSATINAYAGLVTLTANSLSTTYNGLAQTASGFTATGLLGSDATNATTTMSGYSATVSGTNAGSYTSTVTGTNVNTNYSNIALATGTLSIAQATAAISATKTYDGTTGLTSSQVTITGVTVNGNTQSLSYTGTATLSDANVTTSNKYVVDSGITLTNGTGSTIGLASNYVLPSNTYVSNQNSATVTPAVASLSATKVYDGTTSLTAGQVTITGVTIGGNTQVLAYTGTATLSDANVATASKYVVDSSMTLANAGSGNTAGVASNYVLPTSGYSASADTATVTAATATISATKVYDATTSLSAGQVTISGVTVSGSTQILGFNGTAVANNANVSANGSNYVSGITLVNGGSGSTQGLASNYALPSLSAYSSNNSVTINAYAGQVTLTAASLSTTYNATAQTASGFTATGLQGSDASAVATTLSGYAASVTATNAGSYTNAVTGSNTNTNYSNIVTVSGTLTIAQATASISATKTYDNTTSLSASQVTITGVNGEVLGYTGTATTNSANVSANGSNYVLGITALANGTGGSAGLAQNYVLPSLTVYSSNNTATISAYAGTVTLTANSLSTTYTGSTQSVSGFTASGLLGTDVGNYVTSMSGYSASVSGTNAGSYTNTVTGTNTNANYSNIVLATGALTIGQATATLSATKVYDGTTALTSSQVTLTGVTVNGVTQVLGYTGTATVSDANVATANKYVVDSGLTLANAGSGSTAGLAANYVLPSSVYASGSNSATVTAATANITATKVYDGTTSLTGSQVTVTGVTVAGSTQTLTYTGTASLSDANVATSNKYVVASGITLANGVTGTIGLASNYVLPTSAYSAVSNSATVTAATAVISATKVYDSTTSLTTSQVSITGVTVGGHTQVLGYTGTATLSDANVATANKYVNDTGITLANGGSGSTLGLGSNYVLPSSVYSSTLNTAAVTPATVTLSAAKTYDGLTALTGSQITITGVNSETLSYSGATAASANVDSNGTNYINAITLVNGTGVNAGTASNYALPTLSVTKAPVTISKAALTITASADAKTYADTTTTTNSVTYDNTGTALLASSGFSATGLVNAETVASVTLSSAGGQASATVTGGPYTITPSTAALANGASLSNYSVTYATGSLTVNPLSLTVTGSTGLSKTYDATTALPSGTAGYTVLNYTTNSGVIAGLPNSDAVTVSGTPVFSSANAGSVNVVQGTFALSGTAASNYSVNWVNGATSTINKAVLTVTANDATKLSVQTDMAGVNGVSYSGFVGGQTSSVLATAPTVTVNRANATANAAGLSTTNDGTDVAGTYTGVLVPSGAAASNYSFNYVNGNYTNVGSGTVVIQVASTSVTYGTTPTLTVSSVTEVTPSGSTVLALSLVSHTGNTYTYTDNYTSSSATPTTVTSKPWKRSR